MEVTWAMVQYAKAHNAISIAGAARLAKSTLWANDTSAAVIVWVRQHDEMLLYIVIIAEAAPRATQAVVLTPSFPAVFFRRGQALKTVLRLTFGTTHTHMVTMVPVKMRFSVSTTRFRT